MKGRLKEDGSAQRLESVFGQIVGAMKAPALYEGQSSLDEDA